MSGFSESKSLRRSNSMLDVLMKWRDEKRCLRHIGTMNLQVCDRTWRDLMLSLSSANNSVMCNKTSSGSVSSESMIEVGCTQGGCNNVARRISRAEPVSNQVNSNHEIQGVSHLAVILGNFWLLRWHPLQKNLAFKLWVKLWLFQVLNLPIKAKIYHLHRRQYYEDDKVNQNVSTCQYFVARVK